MHGVIILVFRQVRSQKRFLAVFNTISCALLLIFALMIYQQAKRSSGAYDGLLLHVYIGMALAILALAVAGILISTLLFRNVKTTRRLEDAEEMSRLLQEKLNDGLFEFTPLTGRINFSPSYRSQLGYTEENLPDDIEQGFNQLLHPEDRDKVWQEMEAYIHQQIPTYAITYRLQHTDGSWLWMLSRAVGIWNDRGDCLRFVGIHTDITEQKKQEEALREVNNELESFTYIASHDLRSPLVNLKGFTKEIENSLHELGEKYKQFSDKVPAQEAEIFLRVLEKDIPEALSFIYGAVEKMDQLTGAILNLSRIGRRVYRSELVDMNELVKRCIENLNYDITERDATVTVDPLPHVTADRLAMDQLFSNIIENAVKYLVSGRPGHIHIQAKDTHAEVIFSIQDNGRGIEQEDSKKIFDIFRRARNTGDVRGVGMGLAFVRTTIRKMNGRLWYISAPDEGTTFYIAIPKLQTQGELNV